MKILVTGACGFVGRNLCAQLENIRQGKPRGFEDFTIEEIYPNDIGSVPEELVPGFAQTLDCGTLLRLT